MKLFVLFALAQAAYFGSWGLPQQQNYDPSDEFIGDGFYKKKRYERANVIYGQNYVPRLNGK